MIFMLKIYVYCNFLKKLLAFETISLYICRIYPY